MFVSDDLRSLPISIIRQHAFCPRIPFYNEILGINPSNRLWQKQGLNLHKRQTMLFKRRNLEKFGFKDAYQKHNVSLKSDKYGIHGICDAILFTSDELCPLEFKLESSNNIPKGHVLQLAAYALVAEQQFEKPCYKLFILYGQRGHTMQIDFDEKLKNQVKTTVKQIKQNLQSPLLPHSSASDAQCGQCEYLNFCADRND